MNKNNLPSEQTQYAKSIDGTVFHINQVERGRNGYFCIGCDHELVACQGDIQTSWYFRHHATDVTIERTCTFSSETYRHQLGKEILQRIKQIRVPAVDKYGPTATDPLMRIEEAKTITAAWVGIEYTFYEDECKQIAWMTNGDWQKASHHHKHLIIQPDVTFFDHQSTPILFIELVATHKPDEIKLLKLNRLCIDTVAVSLPKDSPAAIEAVFYTPQKTKWLYNHVEKTTRYLRLSSGNPTSLLPVDTLQRRLFGESVSCRSTEIGNLIRAIGECLESQQYRAVKQKLNSELSNLTEHTDTAQQRLDKLQRTHTNRIKRTFAGRWFALKKESRILTAAKCQQQANRRGLEKRYLRKRSQLITQTDNLADSQQAEIERLTNELIRLGIAEADIRISEADFEDECQAIEARIESARTSAAELRHDETTLPERFDTETKKLRHWYRQQRKTIGQVYQSKIRELIEADHQLRERLRNKPDQYREQAVEAVANPDSQRVGRLSQRISALFAARGIISHYREKQRDFERLQAAQRFFKSGAYKSGIEPR